MSTRQVNNLVRAMNRPSPKTNRAIPPGGFLKGTVTAVQLAAGTISCTIMGDQSTTLAGISFLDTYTPVVGDNCVMIKHANALWALGTIQGSGLSNSWTPVPGLTGYGAGPGGAPAYRVVLDNGDLKVQLKGSMSCPGTGSGEAWAYPSGSLAIPQAQRFVPLVTNSSSIVFLQFETSGAVVLSNSGVSVFYLDGVEYFIE